MKKLVKMKIINWHLFSNLTIEIKNNVVVTGENGTGKSTLLDALQYVLTAGRAKFNSAANDSGKRNIGRQGKCRAALFPNLKEALPADAVNSEQNIKSFRPVDIRRSTCYNKSRQEAALCFLP